MQNWCFQNLLLLNPNKTKLMVYGTRQMHTRLPNDFCLSLLENDLISGGAMKDLGPTLDRNLSFNHHIVKVTASYVSTCKSKELSMFLNQNCSLLLLMH